MRRLSPQIVCLLASVVLVYTRPAFPEARQNERVLMICELGISAPVAAVATQEIIKTLQNSHHAGLDFYFESLDTNLFSDKARQSEIEDWLLRKYRDRKPDVIIAAGPTPLQFLATSQRFFPDVPVVFVGTFKQQAQFLKLSPRFTGVWFHLEPAKTLEIAAKLQPDTRNVFVVGGSSPLDRLMESIVQSAFRPYADRYTITYLIGSRMPELQAQLEKLPGHSIVVFTLLFEDGSGRHFIPETQALPLILKASNAPVFQTVDVGIGSGSVGGYVASIAGQGRHAAEDVIKILDGVSPADIPEAYGATQYMFDWRAIERWHLDKHQIPPGSVVLFREPTAWERYKLQIITAILIITLLSALSIYLAFETQRRKHAEAAIAASLRFEHIISELSTHFIDLPADKIDTGIEGALERLVRALEIDRITVFKFSADRQRVLPAYVSAMDEAAAIPNEISGEEFKWYFSKLLQNDCVVINRVRDLPPEVLKTKVTLRRYGITSGVAVPLEAENAVFGCVSFVLTSGERVWTDRLVTQLRMIGQVIANALIRKQTDEERLELSGLLINAQETERTRLARELHDDFSQRVAVLGIDLQAIPKTIHPISSDTKERLIEIGNLVAGIGADLHSLSHRLHSATLDSLGLVDALDSLCDEYNAQADMEVNFVHERVPESLPADLALCLFRVAQEALRNVKKHSRASCVELRLSAARVGIQLSIIDNGIGFNPGDVTKKAGLGLRSMQERLRLAGGSLQVHSVIGQGTIIEAAIPDLEPVAHTATNDEPALRTPVGG